MIRRAPRGFRSPKPNVVKRWGAPTEHAAPAGLEAREVETAQARDLILEWSVLVSHGISPRWTDLKPLERC